MNTQRPDYLFFWFLFSFVVYFVTKEILLLNAELVFIVSFLIFFFVALEKLSATIISALDKYETDIRTEFRKLLLLKLVESRETRKLLHDIRPYNRAMLEFVKFIGDYVSFLQVFKRKCLKAHRRYLITIELINAYKQLINRIRFINETNIRYGAFLIRKEMQKLRIEQKEIKHLKTIRSIAKYKFKFIFLVRRKARKINGKKKIFLRPVLKIKRLWRFKRKKKVRKLSNIIKTNAWTWVDVDPILTKPMGPKRPRGRPRKYIPEGTPVEPKRPRGRPRKDPSLLAINKKKKKKKKNRKK